jgi:two-component system, NtrC family, response regulator HydG
MKQDIILIVDDDPGHLTMLTTIVRSWGYRVETAETGHAAVERVKSDPVDLILMDVRMAEMSGIEALSHIKAFNPAIPIVIMTAYSSVESAIAALKAGAYDYLIKPLDFEVLKLALERAGEHAGLKVENLRLKAQLNGDQRMPEIIGRGPHMQALIDMVAMIAPSDATVLIAGESGTGKELIARSIHFGSPRKDRPLVVVNCAAISETLLESELFGHEKGAFTGADRRREGRFMQADGGTLFLDEIGETSPAMQVKLLRVIQEREVQRVGGQEVIAVDVRIIAATNRDLMVEVRAGRFREDLYYRLNVVSVQVPALRQHREDIPLLVQYFLQRYAAKNRKTIKGLSPLAMDLLIRYDWPGNVRELENAIERAVILLTGEHITEKQLPETIVEQSRSDETAAVQEAHAQVVAGAGPLEEIERQAILSTLTATGGNKSEAARRLGITRKTLHNKLKHYGVA